MSEIKLYDTEARMELVMNSGPRHYTAHVNHMTTEDLRSKSDIAVELAWRDLRIEQLIAQLEAAQKERDGLREKVNQADTEWQKMADRILAVGKRAETAEAQLIKAEKGEVLVTVSGFTGCGKSAVAGEIEIALLAIGVPVRWTNGDAERRMTGADYLTALEMYKPHVRIVERNIAGGKWYE